jgi:hypothetical protein
MMRLFWLLGNPRKTVAEPSAQPEYSRTSCPAWGRASAPFALLTIGIAQFISAADVPAPRPVNAILADYVKAVGGQEAVDRLTTRETVASVHHGGKVTFYWEKPNHALAMSKRERTGYDGANGWLLSMKRKVKKLARGAEIPLELNANPLRFVHIQDFYSELNPAPAAEIDGEKMEVIVAPNNVAATKLYFDAGSHLLRRVEENGEISAYFTNTVDYLEYQEVDSVRLPFHIVHTTSEPGGHGEDLRVKKITHNLPLQSEIFNKPQPVQVVMGGKR